MTRRNWKRIRPHSLRHALELCKEHARERRNLSVERIAELMGLADHWALYKWFQSGRIPANLIRPFEQVCGIAFVTQWLAGSSGKLLVDMPTGKAVDATEVQQLQEAQTEATAQILKFANGQTSAEEAIAAIVAAMTGLAWHKGNIEKHAQPELELNHD